MRILALKISIILVIIFGFSNVKSQIIIDFEEERIPSDFNYFKSWFKINFNEIDYTTSKSNYNFQFKNQTEFPIVEGLSIKINSNEKDENKPLIISYHSSWDMPTNLDIEPDEYNELDFLKKLEIALHIENTPQLSEILDVFVLENYKNDYSEFITFVNSNFNYHLVLNEEYDLGEDIASDLLNQMNEQSSEDEVYLFIYNILIKDESIEKEEENFNYVFWKLNDASNKIDALLSPVSRFLIMENNLCLSFSQKILRSVSTGKGIDLVPSSIQFKFVKNIHEKYILIEFLGFQVQPEHILFTIPEKLKHNAPSLLTEKEEFDTFQVESIQLKLYPDKSEVIFKTIESRTGQLILIKEDFPIK